MALEMCRGGLKDINHVIMDAAAANATRTN
jgi:hypothetical protein